MINELHWGGINCKSLCKAVFSDIWMVFAVMVIAYIGLGIAGNMQYTPSYTSSAVVAVYPFNRMYTLETSSSALETVGAVNEVLNSEMFRTGLNERLAEPIDYSLYSQRIDRTLILMLSVSCSSPENAYKILKTALDYYGEISSRLVGNSQLEILTEPDFPISPSNSSKLLERRLLLTLFMGFAATVFLVLVYVMRKTYKSAATIQNYYKNVRFFSVAASASDKNNRRNKERSGSKLKQKTVRKTALELAQMLRAKGASSVFVTSASHNEEKTELTVSLAREMSDYGKSVLIFKTDTENTNASEYFGKSEDLPQYTLSELLQYRSSLESVAADIPDKNIKLIFVNNNKEDDTILYKAEDVKKIIEQAETFVDVILIDGCIWIDSGDDRIWREAADASLAVCRQDKADFYAIDSMMTDLQENDPEFLGCVLYGF